MRVRRPRVRTSLPPGKPASRRSAKQPASDPELLLIWQRIIREYFPEHSAKLLQYQIRWSNRPQKRTLASCNISDLRVKVARELNYSAHYHWLEPLIYHEMCHAVLGYEQKKKKRSWHGANFKRLEQAHPQMRDFDFWVTRGGWTTAVRSDRAKRAFAKLRTRS